MYASKLVSFDITKRQYKIKNYKSSGAGKPLNPTSMINSSSIIRKNLCYWDNSSSCLGVEDYDLWLRLWRGGKKFYNCSEILVKHRIHQTSAFNNSNANLVPALIQKYSV
jgi:GT2 family glycosyltransferase